MSPKWMKLAGRLLVGVLISIAISGCSSDQPLAPTGAVTTLNSLNPTDPPGDQVQFAARVQTTNQSRQMLTFVGQSDTGFCAHNCVIVRLNNGQDTPIPFSEIHPGDSVDVHGARQQNGDLLMTHLRLCQDSAGCYDLAFRDTIAAIDYATNSFTIKGRTELITVDANTVIWGQISHYQNGAALGDGTGERYQYDGAKNRGQFDTTLAFTDLAVGDVVEIRADVVSEGVLLALVIKVANCGQTNCLTFFTYLATVDATAKIVTFSDQPWIGWVGQNADLTGLDDEPLTLSDFSAGDFVQVKGFATTGDTLKVCQMSKETL